MAALTTLRHSLHGAAKASRSASSRAGASSSPAAAMAMSMRMRRNPQHGVVMARHVNGHLHRGAWGVAQPLRAVSSGATAQEETFEYQAEVNRLLDLIVNSLYSNKDVFLRELVSNASDALDKMRFVSVQDPSLLTGDDKSALDIEVQSDPEKGTVTITDTGVGMTRSELLDSLGTIAKSGTAKFMEALKKQEGNPADASLIGQFGVGFYSSFLVADRVTVQTKSYRSEEEDGGKGWIWESAIGSVNYTIKEDDASSDSALQRGTRITLHLKEDSKDFADHMKLRDLIRQYSEFIGFPIKLWTTKTVTKQVVDDEATEKKKKEMEEKSEDTTDMEPVMKTDHETAWDWIVQNENKPLWLKSAKECEKEEYNSFFKATFKEFMDPLAYNHFKVEGTYEFSGIVYIPGMAPFDGQDAMAPNRNVRLYVNKVFISDKFDESFLPRYLSFVKGVVDSRDLPLNVSREILQQSRVSRVMRKQLVKRTLDTLADVAKKEGNEEGKDDYGTFWEAFGRNLKLGVIEDQDNRPQLSKLLRFQSSKSGDGLTSLDKYVEGMKENQKGIYYVAADSKEIAEGSPFVEELLNRDIEILYLVEPIDEVCVANLGKFGETELIDVSKEDLLLDEEDDEMKKKSEELAGEFSKLCDWMKDVLGQKVEKVVVSKRAMTNSPCMLVTSKFGWSANMEKIMRAQAMGDNRALEYMSGKKILELNPSHDIVVSLKSACEKDPKDSGAKSMVDLMYETALLTSGFSVESPKEFASRVYEMISAAAKAKDTTVTAEVLDEDPAGGDADPWKK